MGIDPSYGGFNRISLFPTLVVIREIGERKIVDFSLGEGALAILCGIIFFIINVENIIN